MRVKVTLVLGIALLAAVGAIVLTRSPPRVVAARSTPTSSILTALSGDISVCQTGEALPANVSAVRLSMWAFVGWPVRVLAYSGSRLITEGRRSASWTSDSVTVPVRPLGRATSNVVLCFAIGPNSEPVLILGQTTSAVEAAAVLKGGTPGPRSTLAGRLPGRVGVEYLASGQRTWWSSVLSVARRMGLGRSFSGTWIALLVAALMAAVGVLALRLTLREIP
jgi:hypothetical protein